MQLCMCLYDPAGALHVVQGNDSEYRLGWPRRPDPYCCLFEGPAQQHICSSIPHSQASGKSTIIWLSCPDARCMSQVTLVARYWTWLFLIFCLLSYFLVYPFEILFPLVEMLFGIYDSAQYGIAVNIFANPSFWFVVILANLVTFGHRFIERAVVWLFRPNDDMILVELESLEVGPRALHVHDGVSCMFLECPLSTGASFGQNE